MGVVAAAIIGGTALAGMAGGMMGSMGKQGEAKAQHHMQKMQAMQDNYLNQRNTDIGNWAGARKAAITSINNKKIAQASVKAYADSKRANRMQFQSNSHEIARSYMSLHSSMVTEATGKNIRGGTVERMKAVADKQSQQTRINNRIQYSSAEEAAKNQFKASLNQRDTLTRYEANMYVPSTMPPEPASGFTLEMLASGISGGASGASAGSSIYANSR